MNPVIQPNVVNPVFEKILYKLIGMTPPDWVGEVVFPFPEDGTPTESFKELDRLRELSVKSLISLYGSSPTTCVFHEQIDSFAGTRSVKVSMRVFEKIERVPNPDTGIPEYSFDRWCHEVAGMNYSKRCFTSNSGHFNPHRSYRFSSDALGLLPQLGRLINTLDGRGSPLAITYNIHPAINKIEITLISL